MRAIEASGYSRGSFSPDYFNARPYALALAYLAAAGRWRTAFMVGIAGLAVLGVSVVLNRGAWQAFVDVVGGRAGTDGGSLVPIPFVVRFGAGALLAVVAGRLSMRAAQAGGSQRVGESLLIVALVVANPTLWVTALSMLVAIVPLWRAAPARDATSTAGSGPTVHPGEKPGLTLG